MRKIDIPKNKLKKLYQKRGLSANKIADIFKCSDTPVYRLLKEYGIKTTQRWQKINRENLSYKQRQIVLGSLMGDACIPKLYSGEIHYRIHFAHKFGHKAYLAWKNRVLYPFSLRIGIKKEKTSKHGFQFRTIGHPIFKKLRNSFYPNGRKTVPNEIMEINSLGLATWFMDDGAYHNYILRLSTDSFNKEGINRITNYFGEKWNMFPKIGISMPSKTFHLKFLAKDRNRFFKIIKPHIVPCMSYKLS